MSETTDKVRPIILVGMNRTGTKWISNILCSHNDIAGIQSQRARGILETNMFGAMQDKFDLRFPDEYIGLIELWSVTEFFTIAGIEKTFFYRRPERPDSVLAVFELLMNEFASRQRKRFWLQKTSPLRAGEALSYFDDAIVVVARRNLLDTLRSTWRLQMRHGDRRIVRSTFAYIRQKKILDKLVRSHEAIEVDYDRLRSDPESEISKLFAGLGLDPAHATGEVSFKQNTSFDSEKQREATMSSGETFLVSVMAFLFASIPLAVIDAAVGIKDRLVKGRPLPLMPGTFGELFDELEDVARK